MRSWVLAGGVSRAGQGWGGTPTTIGVVRGGQHGNAAVGTGNQPSGGIRGGGRARDRPACRLDGSCLSLPDPACGGWWPHFHQHRSGGGGSPLDHEGGAHPPWLPGVGGCSAQLGGPAATFTGTVAGGKTATGLAAVASLALWRRWSGSSAGAVVRVNARWAPPLRHGGGDKERGWEGGREGPESGATTHTTRLPARFSTAIRLHPLTPYSVVGGPFHTLSLKPLTGRTPRPHPPRPGPAAAALRRQCRRSRPVAAAAPTPDTYRGAGGTTPGNPGVKHPTHVRWAAATAADDSCGGLPPNHPPPPRSSPRTTPAARERGCGAPTRTAPTQPSSFPTVRSCVRDVARLQGRQQEKGGCSTRRDPRAPSVRFSPTPDKPT